VLNTPQLLSVAVIVVMMAAFIWGRFRYDLVAALSLLLAVAVGVVPAEKAFSGFSDDIVIIVGSALLVSAGVARSGIMAAAIQRYVPVLTSVRLQMLLLVSVVAVLSAFVKNIGALAIMMPIAFQFARRSGASPSVFLMPMAFASLLGGLMTQIGTSPNIVVSRLRAEITGTSFSMFDFTPVGLALTVVGVTFLMFFYWLVPVRQRQDVSVHQALDIRNYVTEARVTAESAAAGKTLGDLLKIAGGEAIITSVMREGAVRITPFPDATLRAGDRLIIEGDPEALDRVVGQGDLSITGNRRVTREGKPTEVVAIEAVVGEASSLAGWSASGLLLFHRFNVNILAVSRKGVRLDQSPGDIEIRMGDVLLLQGDQQNMPEFLREFGLLPLAERTLPLGSTRRGIVALAILATAMGVTAVGLLPVAFAFFSAAVAMVLFKVVPLREVMRMSTDRSS
jgi:Di- and tricarboxylate transporters